MPPRRGTARMLAVARGDEPADLVIKGGRVFVPVLGSGYGPISRGRRVIAGWGMREARDVVEVDGASLTAAFIDPHMHLESTKLWVDEFVRTVLPHGTTAVAADPHEIAKRLRRPGRGGLRRCHLRPSVHIRHLRFELRPRLPVPRAPGPSSVPPKLKELLEVHGALGIGRGHERPRRHKRRPGGAGEDRAAGSRRVDGHAPGILGRQLDAYLVAGVESDHECTDPRRGGGEAAQGDVDSFVREGSASRNLSGTYCHGQPPRHRPGVALCTGRPRARHASFATAMSTTACVLAVAAG